MKNTLLRSKEGQLEEAPPWRCHGSPKEGTAKAVRGGVGMMVRDEAG